MRSPDTIIADAKKRLKEVVVAMCHRPDLVTIGFREYQTNILVQISAHPNDAKILVGKHGAHISALSNVANLLCRGSHKLVQIMPIESIEGETELPYKPFTARADWPQAKLVELIEGLAKAVFQESEINVRVFEENSSTSIFEVTIQPLTNASAAKRFGSAVAILFVPIGTNHGRMIFANVRSK